MTPSVGDLVITRHQPFADLYVAGVVPVLNTTWRPPSTLPQWGHNPTDGTRVAPGGWGPLKYDAVFGAYEPDGPFPFRLFIHAAAERPAEFGGPEWDAWRSHLDRRTRERWQDRLGALLGTVEVTGAHHADDCWEWCDCPYGTCTHSGGCSRWAQPDRWHWTLTNPQTLDRPIPARGRQRIWRLTADDLEVARA